IVYGSAKGFRSKPWNAAPANPKAAPTQKASTTLGNRMFQIIISTLRGTSSSHPMPTVFSTIICTIIDTGNDTLLMNRPKRAVHSTNPPDKTYSHRILLVKNVRIDELPKSFHSFDQSRTRPCNCIAINIKYLLI